MPCTSGGRAFHAGCVRLRAIPFRGSTRADRRYRELFVKRYFGDWMCRECERRPAVVCAPPVAAPAGCASCAALAARVAELEKARLADVPREHVPREVRDTPVRRAREGERASRERWRGRAGACALPGEGGLAVRRRRENGPVYSPESEVLVVDGVRVVDTQDVTRARARGATILLRHLRRLRRVEGFLGRVIVVAVRRLGPDHCPARSPGESIPAIVSVRDLPASPLAVERSAPRRTIGFVPSIPCPR